MDKAVVTSSNAQLQVGIKVDGGSLIFAAIFIAIFSLMVVFLRYAVNNDIIFGPVRKLRACGFSMLTIKALTWL
jgi:hypothetical protein